MATSIHSEWGVDQAIVDEPERLVLIRFGWSGDPLCSAMDEILVAIANEVIANTVIYKVDLAEVKDYIVKYDLYDPCNLMFFYKNKAITLDAGFGPCHAINWPLPDCDVLLKVIDIVGKEVRKGKADAGALILDISHAGSY